MWCITPPSYLINFQLSCRFLRLCSAPGVYGHQRQQPRVLRGQVRVHWLRCYAGRQRRHPAAGAPPAPG